MKLTKRQLIEELHYIISRLEEDDSYQGNINYDAFDENCGFQEFEVKGAYRYGNSEGQGYMRIYS